MSENAYSVYCHLNKINGKRYFGITKQQPEKRWGRNGRNYKNQAFYNAIQKYGWDNFEHIILFTNVSKEFAENKEIELISEFKTFNCDYGYNLALGGDCGTAEYLKKPIIEYNATDYSVSNRYSGISDAERITGLTNINLCCSKKHNIYRIGNRIFRYEDSPLTQEEIEWYKRKFPKIYQYDFDGNLLNIFNFINDAQDWLMANGKTKNKRGKISTVCSGKATSYCGYIWRKSFDKFDTYPVPNKHQHKIIEQRDIKTGKLIKSYDGIKAVSDSLNYITQSNILSCCDLNIVQTTAYGFYWCYKGNYNPKDLIKGRYKSISQYDMNNNYIATYDSMDDIATFLGKKTNEIHEYIKRVCRKERKSTFGYKWFYADDESQPDKTKIMKIEMEVA